MMENIILFEDMEYSITSSPGGYNHFIDNFKQQYHCDIDQLIIEGRIIKVEEKPINERRGWHYFGKNKFDTLKNELDEYYKINDPERLRLNPHLIDQIRNNTEEKKANIEKLQQQLLNIENNPISFANDCWEYSDVEHWLYVINKIIEQPIYIIEAIEKYSDKTETNQRDYLRYEYINSKISEAGDRHKESFRHMQFKYMMTVKMGSGIDIKPLIYFFEGLIDELVSYTSGIDYIDTPLFRMLFSEFNVYYSREITKYNPESFPNIEQVKKRLNELKPQQIGITDQEVKAKTDEPEAKDSTLDHSELLKSLSKYIDGINPIGFSNIIEHHSLPLDNTPPAKWIGNKADARRFGTFIKITRPAFNKCFSLPDGKPLVNGIKDETFSPITAILKDYFKK